MTWSWGQMVADGPDPPAHRAAAQRWVKLLLPSTSDVFVAHGNLLDTLAAAGPLTLASRS